MFQDFGRYPQASVLSGVYQILEAYKQIIR